jgi:hypothetical protein
VFGAGHLMRGSALAHRRIVSGGNWRAVSVLGDRLTVERSAAFRFVGFWDALISLRNRARVSWLTRVRVVDRGQSVAPCTNKGIILFHPAGHPSEVYSPFADASLTAGGKCVYSL